LPLSAGRPQAGVEGAAQAAGAGDYRFGDVSRSIAGGVTQTAAGTGTFLAGFFAAQEVKFTGLTQNSQVDPAVCLRIGYKSLTVDPNSGSTL
jgi:hypothetical protein